jgi:hypothetical protein
MEKWDDSIERERAHRQMQSLSAGKEHPIVGERTIGKSQGTLLLWMLTILDTGEFHNHQRVGVHLRRMLGAGGVAKVIECVPCKCEALISNSRTTKKSKKGRDAWYFCAVALLEKQLMLFSFYCALDVSPSVC